MVDNLTPGSAASAEPLNTVIPSPTSTETPTNTPTVPASDGTPSYWEKDEQTLDKIRRAAEEHVAGIQEKNPTARTNEALLASWLGTKLYEGKEFRAAYQCYQHAFQITPPYDRERLIRARNLVDAMSQYYRQVSSQPDQQAEWFKGRRGILQEAVDCMAHYRNLLVLKNGEKLMQDKGIAGALAPTHHDAGVNLLKSIPAD